MHRPIHSTLKLACRPTTRGIVSARTQEWRYHVRHIYQPPNLRKISLLTRPCVKLNHDLCTPQRASFATTRKQNSQDVFVALYDQYHAPGGKEPQLLKLRQFDDAPTLEDVQKRLRTWMKGILSPSHSDHPEIDTIEIVSPLRLRLLRRQEDRVALEIQICRLEKVNALNAHLMKSLTILFQALAGFEQVRCIILSAQPHPSGKHVFCGGGDVSEISQIQDHDQAAKFISVISALCTEIRKAKPPVVVAIDGMCIGGGLEVAASCDIRVATKFSTFSMPEVLLSIPSVVEARLLTDLVGWGRARHLMLTGCVWDADEAYSAGLITGNYESSNDMWKWLIEYCDQCNSYEYPIHAAQKSLFTEWEDNTIDAGIKAGVSSFSATFNAENRAAVHAVIEKHVTKMKSSKRK